VSVIGVRVGTDVESIEAVRASLARFGSRYADRIFTDHEVASVGGIRPEAAPGLTARFAAKEAVLKLLQPVDLIPTWRSIEIRKSPGGSVSIDLSGDAAVLAQQSGISSIALSLSHGAGIGMATVVGLVSRPDSSIGDEA
jgi:holo-[acyl-carrier protein] synthase